MHRPPGDSGLCQWDGDQLGPPDWSPSPAPLEMVRTISAPIIRAGRNIAVQQLICVGSVTTRMQG